MKKLAVALALALGLSVTPISPAQMAQATNCLGAADSYAQSPDNFGYKYMYDCYKSAGLLATESTCAKFLQEAIGYYRLDFKSSGFNSIVKYDNCRAVLPKTPSSTTSNGSTSTGNSTGVVGPGCTAAPEAPVVKYRNTLTGLVVSIAPSATGQTAARIAYSVNYYDSLEKKWLGWSPWVFVTGASDLTFTKPTESQTKVAFDSLAQNPCGSSARTRADSDKKGLLILSPPVDEISQVVTAVNVGVAVKLSQLASTLSGRPSTVRVLTPRTCQISGDSLSARAAGDCSISITSSGTEELVAKTSTLTLRMVAPQRTITCFKKGNAKVVRKVTAVSPKCPTGFSTKR